MINQRDVNFFVAQILKLDPDRIRLRVDDFQQLIFPFTDFEILGVFGVGAYGMVLATRFLQTGDVYATKLMRYEKDSEKEFVIQHLFSQYDMAPKLFHQEVVDTKYGIKIYKVIMERITSTVANYLQENNDPRKLFFAFECLIKKKFLLEQPFPYLHGDMHIGNIAILKDGKTLGFIDFGLSRKKTQLEQFLDCIPLIGGLKFMPNNKGEPLAKFLMKFYERMFKVTLSYNDFVKLPVGGYTYVIQRKEGLPLFLHSYSLKNTGLKYVKKTVDDKDIKEGFSSIEIPAIMN